MKTPTQFLITGFIALAAWSLAGCQSADNGGNTTTGQSSSTSPTIAVSGANEAQAPAGGNPAEALVGRKTFNIAPAEGGGNSPITGVDGGASQSVASTIRANFEQRGYVYQDNGPSDLVVTPKWIYSGNDNLAQTAVPGVSASATATTREVSLNVIVKDAATDKVLWSEEDTNAVLTTGLSPNVAAGMANQALHDLPVANPGGQYSNASATNSSTPANSSPSAQPAAAMQP